MKKKTKKNLHVDTPTVSFKDYVNGSKEFEFIKMAKNGGVLLTEGTGSKRVCQLYQ